METKNYHIGTSGWSYSHWKESFYPKELKPKEYLSFLSKTFDVIEINTSFYKLPTVATIANWLNAVPENFKFCPKISRQLTQYQKLNEPEESLKAFFEIFEPLHSHLGPVLVQLPPSLKFEAVKTEHFFKIITTKYKSYDFVLEVRNKSWFEKESLEMLKEYKIGLVISQSDRYPYLEAYTAKNVYYRFHGPKQMYTSDYSDAMLREYAMKFKALIAKGHIIWAFFNNDLGGYAFRNAIELNKMMEE